MKAMIKPALAVLLGFGGAALMGCDETVSKHEETTERPDGSRKEESKEVRKKPDGTVVTEEKKEVTPPTTNPSRNP
jgi:hypothetical protein